MKWRLIVGFLITILLCYSCNQSKEHEVFKVKGKPGILFKITEYNFDTLEYKEKAVYEFEFLNNGDQPLIINNVSTSCGCTASEYSKEPYMADKMGTVKVQYDTRRSGRFSKTISVFSNADKKPVVLKISGFVKKMEKVEDMNDID